MQFFSSFNIRPDPALAVALALAPALAHIIRVKSKTLFNQTQTQMQIQQKCNVNNSGQAEQKEFSHSFIHSVFAVFASALLFCYFKNYHHSYVNRKFFCNYLLKR